MSNRAQIFNHLIAIHANAIIADGQRTRLFIRTKGDLPVAVFF